jgi:hypothetical protein
MLPVAEGNDNGDLFGLYWPIGRESFDPIVAHFWHDDGSMRPAFSSPKPFLTAIENVSDEDLEPEYPSLDDDPASPLAGFEKSREFVKNQEVDAAIRMLESVVDLLPEYTDAQALLWAQYLRVGRKSDAIRTAIQCLTGLSSLGTNTDKVLGWLRNQPDHADFESDPIWTARRELKLKFGGTKVNQDYDIFLRAIQTYLDQSKIVDACRLQQLYTQRMRSETTAFQERYGFNLEHFRTWQIETSALLPAGPRVLEPFTP